MPRPPLSEETKRTREDLRVLALLRLGDGQEHDRAALQAWLASNVDIPWGSQGRPADLGTPEEEADATIRHLQQHGSCEITGEHGNETVRLVQPVKALVERVDRLRDIEQEGRQKAVKRLKTGEWVPVAALFPSSWQAQTLKEVGNRLARAIEQAVIQAFKDDAAYEVRTVDQKAGQVVEELRVTPSGADAAGRSRGRDTGDAEAAGPTALEETGGIEAPARPVAGSIEIVMLPVSQLRANDWNPNLMTDEQEAELLEEVRRLGRPAKPIVVRRQRKHSYEIVDGEHSWKAAVKAGLLEVACEVVQVDTFEAMLQTLKRNEHGTRDPLRTGRVYRRMLELRNMSPNPAGNSLRKLATEIKVSEGTVRNVLMYARAAEVRNAYAPETADETIGNLPVAQIRRYLELPEGRRDDWLDRGGNSDEAARILEEAGMKPKGTKGRAELNTVSPSPAGCEQGAKPADAEFEDTPEPTPAGGECSGEVNAACESHQEEKPAEPLSQQEREVVDGVLKSYRKARTLVQHKILAGLAAYPDAVGFFRRMIKNGS
jgi:ParB-like chromosome segregation protein Spo0J